MSTFRDPVGPLPPNVYWRRRLIVGLGLLALIVIILLIVFRPGGDDSGATDPDAPPTTEPTDSTVEPTTEPTTPAEATACVPGQILLEAIADNTAYAAGENPNLRLEITNTGAADCTLNVGTTEQQFIITSGAEVIWNSQHCEESPQDSTITLEPNVAMQTDAVVWNRTKSSESNCNAGPIAAVADATYQFQVKVGSIESEQVRLRILN